VSYDRKAAAGLPHSISGLAGEVRTQTVSGGGDGVVAFAGEDREAFAGYADFDLVIVLGAVVARDCSRECTGCGPAR